MGELGTIDQKVLREETSSKVSSPPLKCAGIDKLDAYFNVPISLSEISTRSQNLNFTCKQTYLKERAPFIKVSHKDHSIYLKKVSDQLHSSGFSSNPNHFDTWENYVEFITKVLGSDGVGNSKVHRLDLNIDFNCTFQHLIQCIDIRNKRTAVSYIDKHGSRTGINIGRGDESILIYDKALKGGLNMPFSRIELRLKKSKLPTRSILELSDAIKKSYFFTGIEGIQLKFSDSQFTETQCKRVSEFKTILKREGFYTAKRAFNCDRNFDRNFSLVLAINKWADQPHHLFKKAIQPFLQPVSKQ